VIRKSIRLDRVAGIITLLGALTTGHSAFAGTIKFSGTQVYAAAALPLFAAALLGLGLFQRLAKRRRLRQSAADATADDGTAGSATA